MLHRLASVFLATTCLVVVAAADPAAIVAKLVPAAGWTAPEPPRAAVGDDLFDLIDGGAELYHEYGFKAAASWNLAGPDSAGIQVELYEMADPAAAFGVWSLMQTGQFARGDLGQGSLRFGYYVAFWSGRYFASVTGAQIAPAVQAEVDRLAAQLAGLLPRDGAPPAWCGRIPSAERQELKYFRGPIGLSNIQTGLDSLPFTVREGAFVTYPGVRLLVLRYSAPSVLKAEVAKIAPVSPTSASVSASGLGTLEVLNFDEDLLIFHSTDEAAKQAIVRQYAR